MAETSEREPRRRFASGTKTPWDWLQLLLLPVLILALALWLNVQLMRLQQTTLQLGKQQQATSLQIADAQRQDSILTAYITSISDMLVHDKLLHSTPIDDVRVVAQAETLTTLQQLGPERKTTLLRFLFQTKLINNDFRVISLQGADLRGARLHNVDLRDTYLYGADLSGADLSGMNLSYATLVQSNLAGTNLTASDLQGADLRGADLRGAGLAGANLKDVQNLSQSQLAQVKSLSGATLPDGSTHS